jgi:hypothetical protein
MHCKLLNSKGAESGNSERVNNKGG